MKRRWICCIAWFAIVSGCSSTTFKRPKPSGSRTSIASNEYSSWKELKYRGHSYVQYWQRGQSSICHDPDCPCERNGIAKGDYDSADEIDSEFMKKQPTFGMASSKKSVAELDDFEENRFRRIRQSDSGQEAEFFDPATETWVKGVFKRGFEFEGKIAYYIAELPDLGVGVFDRARIAVANESAK